MNMLTFDKTEIQHQNKPFIAEAVFAVETVAANQQRENKPKPNSYWIVCFRLKMVLTKM